MDQMHTLLDRSDPVQLGRGAFVWKGAIAQHAATIMQRIAQIEATSPFRYMVSPNGHMSVAMTSCGKIGWVSSHHGYAYKAIDPLTKRQWPAMDARLATLARYYARLSGFHDFRPSTCLINRYKAGTRLGLHVDADENDRTQPIVAFSLGLPALFRWGGLARSAPTQTIKLEHGDVIVWGGEDRLRYHGIAKVIDTPPTPQLDVRYALTFRYVAQCV